MACSHASPVIMDDPGAGQPAQLMYAKRGGGGSMSVLSGHINASMNLYAELHLLDCATVMVPNLLPMSGNVLVGISAHDFT